MFPTKGSTTFRMALLVNIEIAGMNFMNLFAQAVTVILKSRSYKLENINEVEEKSIIPTPLSDKNIPESPNLHMSKEENNESSADSDAGKDNIRDQPKESDIIVIPETPLATPNIPPRPSVFRRCLGKLQYLSRNGLCYV